MYIFAFGSCFYPKRNVNSLAIESMTSALLAQWSAYSREVGGFFIVSEVFYLYFFYRICFLQPIKLHFMYGFFPPRHKHLQSYSSPLLVICYDECQLCFKFHMERIFTTTDSNYAFFSSFGHIQISSPELAFVR